MSKVELVKGQVFEIDPTKKYMFVFDNRDISKYDVEQIMQQLKEWNVSDSISVVLNDGGAVKVVEI